MMKKLLALVLVLGMVSIASAGLSLTKAGYADNVAVVSSDDTLPWAALVTVTVGLNETTELTPAGTLSLSKNEFFGVVTGEELGFPELGLVNVYDVSVGNKPGEFIVPGAHYLVTLPQGMKLGNVDMGLGRIDLVQYELEGILGTLYVVPEPASMLLLGLGGLFLRRK